MRRLPIALLLLMTLSSCSFPSRQQARDSCEQWAEKGGSYQWFNKTPVYEPREPYWESRDRRECTDEQITNQFLGIEALIKREKKVKVVPKYQVKKHFRY
tara:strand:+ start:281 stop:580 length:300 start_codon:yes stop_codon:yes gene_type:complete